MGFLRATANVFFFLLSFVTFVSTYLLLRESERFSGCQIQSRRGQDSTAEVQVRKGKRYNITGSFSVPRVGRPLPGLKFVLLRWKMCLAVLSFLFVPRNYWIFSLRNTSGTTARSRIRFDELTA